MTAGSTLPVRAASSTAALTVDAQTAAGLDGRELARRLATDPEQGLSTVEAAHRLAQFGPNALRDHRANALAVLGRQFKSALLILLMVTAAVSFALGERTDAVIIGAILAVSIGLGFLNEFRAERATEALHAGVHHNVVVVRDGTPGPIDVVNLVPGDVVHLALGAIVPADVRLISATELECDESVLTGESLPAVKSTRANAPGAALAELTSMALMGTVVRSGAATGIVTATATGTEFGRIAAGLGTRPPETDFQRGLRQFSFLLLQVAFVLTVLILVTNLLLHRKLIDSVLFSLAIAVGITPQLLPAVVSTSLATGSRQLARRKVLVKRLVCIEDLGDMDVLVTDKTGTLTEGTLSFDRSIDALGTESDRPRVLGLLASDVDVADGEAVGGNALDIALWRVGASELISGYVRLGELPFDHERRMTTVVVGAPDGSSTLIAKGAPESVLAVCVQVPDQAQATLDRLFAAGSRVIAVASRLAPGLTRPTSADEHGLHLDGFLVFLDPPKATAAQSLRRLATLGIDVKVATGDNDRVAAKLCADLGLEPGRIMNGEDIDRLDDAQLAEAAAAATIFARISPEHKARLVRCLRQKGRAVGFLGDGVNDALALHAADIGISVDSATDVAKDAADIILLEKSLDVLADGVTEGRRIFANTIKYVLMGTSSNFGNMFSAAAASAFLRFLPMLPSQILLNNLLYDSSQLTIPTDRVDEELLAAPSHWDIVMIRRFMLTFGPISSLFDFITFAVMLGPLHAGADLFRSGWFVESLATQTLIVFVIRTRRVPFFRSRPSNVLLVAVLTVVAIGVALPLSPMAHALGFAAPPITFYVALVLMVVSYLVLVEVAKRAFVGASGGLGTGRPRPTPGRHERGGRLHRRAARFSTTRVNAG